MKKILNILFAILLSTSMIMAEEGKKRDLISPEIQAVISTHHNNVIAERTRFRSEIEKLIGNNPKLLEHFKSRWAKIDERIEERHKGK